MLFKAYPGTDTVKIIWIIPPREMWSQYQKGKLTASKIVTESIEEFKNNRHKLEAPEPDDLSESEMDAIYKEISLNAKKN
jgi:hypothetical protein